MTAFMNDEPYESNETAADSRDAAPRTPRERFQQAAADKQAGAEHDNEDDLWSGSYSHLAMIGTWVGAGVATVAAVVVGLLASLGGQGWLALLGAVVLVWALLVGWYFYRRLSVHYRLTSQRLLHEAGLLWRTVDRIELIDIDDVTYKQGPVERLFGVGAVLISSSDKTSPELLLPGIENVREVADLIDDARRRERRSRGLHIESV